jgi:hypothetical protein
METINLNVANPRKAKNPKKEKKERKMNRDINRYSPVAPR